MYTWTHIHVIKTYPWIFQWNTAILNYFMSCGTNELIKSKVSMIFFQKNYTHLLEREREREGQREEFDKSKIFKSSICL